MTTDPTGPGAPGAARFERILAAIVGGFGVLYGLQATLQSYAAGLPTLNGLIVPITGLIGAGVLLGVLAAVIPVRAALRARLFLVALLLHAAALLLWPLALVGRVDPDPLPWLVDMQPVTCGFLVAAVRGWRAQIAVVLGTAATVILVLHGAGSMPWDEAAATAVHMLLIAVALIVLLGAVRHSIGSAEAAQTRALTEYEDSRLDEALETERVRTDMLVHDSVLMTFLSAAGAQSSGSEALASRMASQALGVLARVRDPQADDRLPLASALRAAEAELAPLVEHVDLRLDTAWDLELPARVADAMVAGLVEAMTASARRRATVRRALLEPFGARGLRVLVEDDSRAPSPAVPAELLDLLRIAEVEVRWSADAVELRWPGPAAPQQDDALLERAVPA